MSEDWMRDRIILIERELGGHAERTRSLEHSDVLLRREITELGVRITDEMNRQHAHLRGELSRLSDAMIDERAELRERFDALNKSVSGSAEREKEQRRIELEEQNRAFKGELDRGKRNMQWAIFVFGVIIVGFEKFLEVAPDLLGALLTVSP